MVKKPSGSNLTPLSCSFDRQSSSSMSDTGSLSIEQFIIGRHGITQSPLQAGEISTLRLEDLTFGHSLGRGASSKVYLAKHVPSGKLVAVKVLQQPPEGEGAPAGSTFLPVNIWLQSILTPLVPRCAATEAAFRGGVGDESEDGGQSEDEVMEEVD